MRTWAKEHAADVHLSRQTSRFVEYYRANGKTMKDWNAAWRNWMLKAQDDAESSRPTRRGGSALERMAAGR
jgi:hypothetical protein